MAVNPIASASCVMLSYTAYGRPGSLLNSKAKSPQRSLQALTLGLFESKLSVHFEAYLPTSIYLACSYLFLIFMNTYIHGSLGQENAARSRCSDGRLYFQEDVKDRYETSQHVMARRTA